MSFLFTFFGYFKEILPALAIGFFLSGVIYEFIPSGWVEKTLGQRGFSSIFAAASIGTILPICCWGSLPVAISFYKKGSRLGPVLAFLVATPATSVTALLVNFRLLGIRFMLFEFFAVILMGVFIGLIADKFTLISSDSSKIKPNCFNCRKSDLTDSKKTLVSKIKSVLKFSFWDMPRQIGPEMFLGLILAAWVATFIPFGLWVKENLAGFFGYIFAVLFGLIMYICSTGTVPLVYAFIKQGLSEGAGMTLLLVGPVTSYGTILVLKKEFGLKVLLVYLGFIAAGSLALGYLFSLV